MNTNTLEKMSTMKLTGMARAFRSTMEKGGVQDLTADEMISQLVEAEWDERYNRKLERSVQRAHFRYKASIEQISYDHERTLDKNQVMRLADCNFIKRKENVIITGSTGIGKSYLASALGHQACALGYKRMYLHRTNLFDKLKIAKADEY